MLDCLSTLEGDNKITKVIFPDDGAYKRFNEMVKGTLFKGQKDIYSEQRVLFATMSGLMELNQQLKFLLILLKKKEVSQKNRTLALTIFDRKNE